jgi:hypothetical protein
LIAEGVRVHGLVQPTLSFSSEIGGKNAPSLIDHSRSAVAIG